MGLNRPVVVGACLTAVAALTVLTYTTYTRNVHNPPKSNLSATAYPNLTTLERTILSADGKRIISWAEYGQGDKVILFFHGIPGSRILTVDNLREICVQRGVRIIVPDRPGIGKTSAPQEGESSLSTATSDIRYLIGYLGIKKVTVVGYSLGSPNTLHFIHNHPTLVRQAYLLAPAGFNTHAHKAVFENRITSYLVEHAPSVLRVGWTLASGSIVQGTGYIDNMMALTPKSDQELLSPQERELWQTTTAETFAQGIPGAWISVLEGFGKKPPDGWGFSLKGLGGRKGIIFYHGTEDVITHIDASRELADLIGNSQVREVKGVGHFGIVRIGLQYVLDDLCQPTST
jgi:pimeloyl-ACP methyl ester carboxylesterase